MARIVRRATRYGGIWAAATAWVIGLGALLCDRFEPYPPLVIGMHTLFAMASSGAICLVLLPQARALAGSSHAELYLFTRLVSRWVYILTYVLAIMRVGLNLNEASRHCASCVGDTAGADIQFYVVCCVAPLWLVRGIVLVLPFKV